MQTDPPSVADLIREGGELAVHCRECGHWSVLAPAALPRPLHGLPIPALEGLFRCSACRSRHSCAMPLYASQRRATAAPGKGWIMPPAQ